MQTTWWGSGVPGVVVVQGGSIPGTAPWYGSGSSIPTVSPLFPHSGQSWTSLWPVLDLSLASPGPLFGLIWPSFGLVFAENGPVFAENGPLFREKSIIFMKKCHFTHFWCLVDRTDRKVSNPYPNPEEKCNFVKKCHFLTLFFMKISGFQCPKPLSNPKGKVQFCQKVSKSAKTLKTVIFHFFTLFGTPQKLSN